MSPDPSSAKALTRQAPLPSPQGGGWVANSMECPGGVLLPVVRMPRQYRGRPIRLLGQHDADELVRPGGRREAEGEIGAALQLAAVAVGAADHEARGGAPVIAPAAELGGKGPRG